MRVHWPLRIYGTAVILVLLWLRLKVGALPLKVLLQLKALSFAQVLHVLHVQLHGL